MSIPVIVLGAGGHAKVVLEILLKNPGYKIVGLLDPKEDLHGSKILGVPVLGDDTQLSSLVASGVRHFFIGLGTVGVCAPRKTLWEFARHQGLTAVNAVHPSSIVSDFAEFGEGTAIMAGAIINAGAKLGVNVIVNTAAVIEHDCVLEDHVHVATGAKLGGNVRVSTEAHIGIGATVREGIQLGEGAIIGAGAVVVKNVPANHVVTGVPARFLRFSK